MALASNITFRSGLLGGVTDFCSDTGLALATPENLVELIVLLARYQEEGVELKPKVYLFGDIDSNIQMLPHGEKLKIGFISHTPEGLKKALKKCAPLSKDGWAIYLSNANAGQCEYGLFSGSSSPVSMDIDQVILDNDETNKVVRLYQLASSCVELQSNSSGTINVFLNHRRDTSEPPLKYFDNLIHAISSKIPDASIETTKNYLSKTIFEALDDSHGCIVAVATDQIPPAYLANDGTTFEQPINFVDLIEKVQENVIKENVLSNKNALVKGMFNTDGIILFDSTGQLLGYNYFVNLPTQDNLNGGARKRAFSSLKDKVGDGLEAVFMQSQDGWTDFKGAVT